MVYIYYMKITHLLLALLVTLPLIAQAQVTVVRIQNHQIYLDTSTLKTPVNRGDSFKVILSSEKLTNPKTGKDLGLVYNYSPVGIITEVQPLYAIGKLPSEAGVEIGQRFAQLCIRRQDHQTVMIIRYAKLGFTAHHAK